MEGGFGAVMHLGTEFGSVAGASGLTFERTGNTVRWICADAETIVTLLPGGVVDVRFVDAPAYDAVSSRSLRCIYRSALSRPYELSSEGFRRLTLDMREFFGGLREPHFAFSGTA